MFGTIDRRSEHARKLCPKSDPLSREGPHLDTEERGLVWFSKEDLVSIVRTFDDKC